MGLFRMNTLKTLYIDNSTTNIIKVQKIYKTAISDDEVI